MAVRVKGTSSYVTRPANICRFTVAFPFHFDGLRLAGRPLLLPTMTGVMCVNVEYVTRPESIEIHYDFYPILSLLYQDLDC